MYLSCQQAITYEKSCLVLYNSSLCEALNSNKTFTSSHKDVEDAVQEESSAWIMRGNIAMTVPVRFICVSVLFSLAQCMTDFFVLFCFVSYCLFHLK